jgi:hypothetical protein
MKDLRQKLLESGVKSLKEFGYPRVDTKNILTDEVYSQFFRRMLDDAMGNGGTLDGVIDELRQELDS